MRHLLIFSLLAFLAAACRTGESGGGAYLRASGETMGTTYHITYRDSLGRNFTARLDSLFLAFNEEVSTYIPASAISRFNRSEGVFDMGLTLEEAIRLPIPASHEHFAANYAASLVYYHASGGAFDPTVMPLVNYWGFGYAEKKPVEEADAALIDSLRRLVGMDSVLRYEGPTLSKAAPGVQLDFSAIAKGYGVDLAGVFLENQGVRDYLVEIGGEVRARGLNDKGLAWTIGINTPDPEAGIADFQTAVRLENRSLATSGNYRNFYEVNGQKYAHTINPATGYPERSKLLSASVFAPTCTEADALATACMVMGLEKAFRFIQSQDHLDAYFIFGNEDGGLAVKYTSGLNNYLIEGGKK